MSYKVGFERMNELLESWQSEYKIFAPVRFEKKGRYSDTDMIRYAQINSVEEIVYDVKSDFSPKEVIFPITQAILYFTESEFTQSRVDDDKIIIFLRSCDIHGIRRLDNMFLRNGNVKDFYYNRLREKVKFVLMECGAGWDTCFCASMGSNETSDYSMAVRFHEDSLEIEVRDEEFDMMFANEKHTDFSPLFVKQNAITVKLPDIRDKDTLRAVHDLDMWKSYNSRCQSCGACNAVCITCSCFTTTDVVYSENGRMGERRRVWASCQHEDFTAMAGGHRFRTTPGERLRFRALHKVYDYRQRFKTEHMCIGCGRCDDRCPEFISFSTMINRLTEEVEKLNEVSTK